MDKTKVTPSEFKGTVRRLSKATYRTGYIPKKVTDAIRKSGASQYNWRSASKKQFMRTIGGLQTAGVLTAKKKIFAPKRIYGDLMEERDESTDTGSDVPMASDKIPGKLTARKFIEYYGHATGKPGDIKAALREVGLPTGAENARPGTEEYLTKRQMLLVLNKVREAGKLTHHNIGKDIAQSFRRSQVFVQEGISSEEDDRLRRYVSSAHEDLPEGVARSIGRPAAGSALRSVGGFQRVSSVGRAAQESTQDDGEEQHATTASALARRSKPNEPKSSAQRMSKTPGHGKAPDLPDLSFDLE